MPSPFPGMDPYLEDPRLWPDVHMSLIVTVREFLATQLRPKYVVRIRERTYTSRKDEFLREVNPPLRTSPQISQEELLKQQKKTEQGDFNLDDFRKQLETLKSMGSMKDLIGAMPGMSEVLQISDDPEEALLRFQGIIDSMTKEERRNPDIIDATRRQRIAKGSGTKAYEVSAILKQFDSVRTIMHQIAKMSIIDRIKFMTGMGRAGAFNPAATMPKAKIGTGQSEVSSTHRKVVRKEPYLEVLDLLGGAWLRSLRW